MLEDIFAFIIRILTGVKMPDVAGLERPRIYYANHSSNLDFVVLWAALPREWRKLTTPVAAEDYWSRNRLRLWMVHHVFHAVLIPRQGITKSNNPLDRMLPVLDQGRSLMIFPEGGRAMDENIMPFRSGLWHLAQHVAGAPIMPVYLENLNRILPKGSFLVVPLIARAEFLLPIFLEKNEDKTHFLERARTLLLNRKQHES